MIRLLLVFSLSLFADSSSQCRTGYSRVVPLETLGSSEIRRLIGAARNPKTPAPSSYRSGFELAGTEEVTSADVQTRVEERLKDQGYEILRVLGKGGLGTVFLAKKDGKEVALKVSLNVTARHSNNLVEEQKLMARVAATQKDPKARYFLESKLVRLPTRGFKTAEPIIEMEFFPGEKTLEKYIDEGYFLKDPGAAEEVSRQLNAAMALAHGVGVVHHDLKPSNVLMKVSSDGAIEIRVIDWGLAALTKEAGGSGYPFLRRPGYALGTPKYMADEQWQAEAATPAFDVHALRLIDHALRDETDGKGVNSVEKALPTLQTVRVPRRALDGEPNLTPRQRRLYSAEFSRMPKDAAERAELLRRARTDRESDYLEWYGKKLVEMGVEKATAEVLSSYYLSENLEALKLPPDFLELFVFNAFLVEAKTARVKKPLIVDTPSGLYYEPFAASVTKLAARNLTLTPGFYREWAKESLRR